MLMLVLPIAQFVSRRTVRINVHGILHENCGKKITRDVLFP